MVGNSSFSITAFKISLIFVILQFPLIYPQKIFKNLSCLMYIVFSLSVDFWNILSHNLFIFLLPHYFFSFSRVPIRCKLGMLILSVVTVLYWRCFICIHAAFWVMTSGLSWSLQSIPTIRSPLIHWGIFPPSAIHFFIIKRSVWFSWKLSGCFWWLLVICLFLWFCLYILIISYFSLYLLISKSDVLMVLNLLLIFSVPFIHDGMISCVLSLWLN